MHDPVTSHGRRKYMRNGWDALLGSSIPAGPARHNWRISMVIQAGWAFVLFSSIISTYYIHERGLSNTQVYTLQATWALVATLGTTAGGWLADRYGIRKVLVCGTALQVFQSIGLASCQVFWQFEIALVFSGIIIALLGGSTDTLCSVSLLREVTDQAEREELYKLYQRITSRLRAFSSIVAILLGNFLATHISMRLPFVLQSMVYIVPLVAAWRATEPREPAPHLSIYDIIKRMRVLMVDQSQVRWSIAVYVITGATSIAGFWLVQPRMLDAGIQPSNFGWIYAAQALCIGLLTWVTKPLQRAKPVVLWSWLGGITGLAALAAGLDTGYAGLAIMLVGFSLFRACSAACLGAYLFSQLGEDDETRSIDLSIVDAIQTLVFGAIGVGIGFVADNASTEAAFLVIGGACLALNGVALMGLRRATRRPIEP